MNKPQAMPLSIVEQYAYTNGACQAFVAAAQQVVGGTPAMLVALDKRQLAQHDWPEDEPLELHIYLTLADGRVLDAEGVRSQEDLSRSFGVRPSWKHEIRRGVAIDAMGKAEPALVNAVAMRLRDLGWNDQHLPGADHALGDKKTYQRAGQTVEEWWRAWTCEQALPEGEAERMAKAWGKIGVDRLGLGENPFHAMAHLPDMIAGQIRKASEPDELLRQMLIQPRHDGDTPLVLVARMAMAKEPNPLNILLPDTLLGALDDLGWMDLLAAQGMDGACAAQAWMEMGRMLGLDQSSPAWQQVASISQQTRLEQDTGPARGTARGARL